MNRNDRPDDAGWRSPIGGSRPVVKPEGNIIRKMLCTSCRNITFQVTHDDRLYNKCMSCNISTRSDPSEYVIRKIMYTSGESDMVVYPSVRDDPCLPIMMEYCPTCKSEQISKYIRNNTSLRISHVICIQCGIIRKILNT